MYWILAVLALGLIIFVHELGHFLTARRKDIPVSIFSIGFGPRLTGFRKGDTDYRISLIPLGGYVLPKLDSIEDLHRIAVGRRIAFSLGGPLANILFAVVLLSLYNSITAGPSIMNTMVHPPIQCASLLISMFTGFISLFTQPGSMSGVVGMTTQGGEIISGGFTNLLVFMVLINLNLAIFNLLPVPVLDGGKIMMALLEKISLKTRKAQVPVTIASLFLLLALMIYTTAADIIGLLTGNIGPF
jgi:regulator of sigma E protease